MKRAILFLALFFAIPATAKNGFILEPQVGLSYTNDWRLAIGAKFMYAEQFNASAMFTRDEYGLAITRRLTESIFSFSSSLPSGNGLSNQAVFFFKASSINLYSGTFLT